MKQKTLFHEAQRHYDQTLYALLYGVSRPTFKKWIEPFIAEIGPRIGNFYMARQVAIIFDRLGWPATEADEG